MSRKQALTELRDKVAANVDNIFPSDFPKCFPKCAFAIRAYYGSLDAALALHNAVLPGWRWEGGSGAGIFAVWDKPDKPHKGRSDCPSRAWLLAILSALIAQEGDE